MCLARPLMSGFIKRIIYLRRVMYVAQLAGIWDGVRSFHCTDDILKRLANAIAAANDVNQGSSVED